MATMHQPTAGSGEMRIMCLFIHVSVYITLDNFLTCAGSHTTLPEAVLIMHQVTRKCLVHRLSHPLPLPSSCMNVLLSLHIYCQGDSVILLCVPNLKVYYPGVAYSYHGTMLGTEKSVVLLCNEYKTFHMIEIQIQAAKSLAAENNKSNQLDFP